MAGLALLETRLLDLLLERPTTRSTHPQLAHQLTP